MVCCNLRSGNTEDTLCDKHRTSRSETETLTLIHPGIRLDLIILLTRFVLVSDIFEEFVAEHLLKSRNFTIYLSYHKLRVKFKKIELNFHIKLRVKFS